MLAKGLKAAEPPLLLVGMKAGFEEAGGGGLLDTAGPLPAEYFDPDASQTFCTIPSGVRSRSDRAII